MICDYSEQRVTQESKCADDIAVSTSSAIFTPAGILPPVIAVFDTAPVVANKAEPACWRQLGALHAADVVVPFRCSRAFLGAARRLDTDQSPGIRPVN